MSLNHEEEALVRQHPTLGSRILENCTSLRGLIPIVLYHHERYDGSGYPEGLKGHDIPLEARILCLADAVEAMASGRPYRRSKSSEEITQEIEACAGKQFDPVLVETFLRLVASEGSRILSRTELAMAS
jgi:HD-GYP domain-containing protein (c-di-GMP phosphodiesterase class II)